MFGLILAILAIAAGAAAVYLLHERLGAAGVGLAALRTAGFGALLLLLLNPARTQRVRDATPTVLLDASLSMGGAGGRWRDALDTARALARGGGGGGLILRFGSRVAEFDTLPPSDGRSELGSALRIARARGGPVVVVTDGELEDVAAIDPTLLEGVRVVVLPRAELPDAAVIEAAVAARVERRDSLTIRVTIETSGPMTADSGRLEVSVEGRRLVSRTLALPRAPGVAQRQFTLPPGLLAPGSHVLRLALAVPADSEPSNNTRWRPVTVAAEPGIVVVAAPAQWEARFFVRELVDVAQVPVRGYALIQSGRWTEMTSLAPATVDDVRRAASAAALVVVFGSAVPALGRTRAVWEWRATAAPAEVLGGEWYPVSQVPASPLAGRLVGVPWDSLPPFTGVVAMGPGFGAWAALSARQGRRGPERPVIVGHDSAGVRRVIVTGEGLWRWAFRGGAPREAYRALVAAATDWLLSAEAVRRAAPLTASDVVSRGVPVAFRWSGTAPPESLRIAVEGDSAHSAQLRFDAEGVALHSLPPGVHRWTADAVPGATGRVIVETYSDEFRPRRVALGRRAGADGFMVAVRHVRENLWLFAVVIAALAGEWVWRHRRGLP